MGLTADLSSGRTTGSGLTDENKGKQLGGWLITSTLFDKYSVVDRGASALLDITPLDDRSYSYFLPHDGIQDAFEKLLNQVTALDI